MEEKKYAVLIDGDNISSKYLDSILQHIKEYIVILQASSHQNGGDL